MEFVTKDLHLKSFLLREVFIWKLDLKLTCCDLYGCLLVLSSVQWPWSMRVTHIHCPMRLLIVKSRSTILFDSTYKRNHFSCTMPSSYTRALGARMQLFQ